MNDNVAFIGGGNMATAIIGGLMKTGWRAEAITVVDPGEDQRRRLQSDFGVHTIETADAVLGGAAIVVWAVKPQFFQAAAAPCAEHVSNALHLSVMAGIRCDTLAATVGSERIVRAMPNTPALVGLGMTGLYASDLVTEDERGRVDTLLRPTGQTLWVADEAALDAVTGLSGSGPAYVFYFLEAMERAAVAMGLTAEDGRRLGCATFAGAAHMADTSSETLATLRQRVTSKGGTTLAAISSLEASGVMDAFVAAMQASQRRAHELGRELGRAP